MKKTKKWLIIRIIFLILIINFLLIYTEVLLKIRDNDYNWNAQKENDTINWMKIRKYIDNDNKYYPLLIDKNSKIKEKARDEKRILVIGDSFVWGYGQSNINYTWWRMLDQKIKSQGYNNINVYAAGKWGYNTKMELDNILNNDKLIKKIDPDLIIIGYVHNDPEVKKNEENVIRDDYEFSKANLLYKIYPKTTKELTTKLNKLSDNYTYLKIVGNLFANRYDYRTKLITEGSSYREYKKVLFQTDMKLKKIGVPYFYYFGMYNNNKIIDKANKKIENTMKKMNIPVYNNSDNLKDNIDLFLKNNSLNESNLGVNPADSHPGVIITNEFSKDVFDILFRNYNYIFDNKEEDNKNFIINDTMPLLNIIQVNKNSIVFNYPKKEKKRTTKSEFLFYPIRKNYIKLNLERPIYIKYITINDTKNIKKLEIYTNNIDQELGIDLDDAKRKISKTTKIGNKYYINSVVSSINISAKFKNESDRTVTLKITR